MANRSLATHDSAVRSFLQPGDGNDSERTFLTNLMRIIRPQREATPRMLLREFTWDLVTPDLSGGVPVQVLPHRADRFAIFAIPLTVDPYGLSPWPDLTIDNVFLSTATGTDPLWITVNELPGLISEAWFGIDIDGFLVDQPRIIDIYKRPRR